MTFNPFTTTYFVKPFLYYTVIQKMSHFFFMSLYLTSHFKVLREILTKQLAFSATVI